MSGKDAFEERLKRLNTSSAPVEVAAPASVKPSEPLPRQPRSSTGGGAIFALFAFAMLALGGGAFATMMFAPELLFAAID